MKISEITENELYVTGRLVNIEQGFGGIPIVPVLRDKFTTVSAPCGKTIQLYEGNKTKQYLVGIREKDLAVKWRWNDKWGSTYEADPLGPDDVWVPVVLSSHEIRMSFDEYKLKAISRQEIVDMYQIATDRLEASRKVLSETIAKIGNKLAPRDRSEWVSVQVKSGDDGKPRANLELTVEQLLAVATGKAPTGIKTLLATYEKQKAAYTADVLEWRRVAQCSRDAGVNAGWYVRY